MNEAVTSRKPVSTELAYKPKHDELSMDADNGNKQSTRTTHSDSATGKVPRYVSPSGVSDMFTEVTEQSFYF